MESDSDVPPPPGGEEDELDEDAESSAEHAEEERPWWMPVPSIHGEFRFRVSVMGDVPLHTEERTGLDSELGQNWWASSWLRLTAELNWHDRLRLVGQMDVADGMLFGETTNGVAAADRSRLEGEAFSSVGVEPRWLYLESLNPWGVIRAGLQPSHWGLGLLANDGAHESPFGDYQYGNTSIRLAFGTRPAGRDVPFTIAVAGDLVFRDPLARLTDGEKAYQGILALSYGDASDDIVGAYVVRRSGRRSIEDGAPEDRLDVWAMDLFAQTRFDDPTGKGVITLAFEGVHIRGDTTYSRTADRAVFDVNQSMFAFQAGRTSENFDVFLEAGYTSGDSNTEDSVQRRATMHPDHRIGLILFPELMAWHSARSSTLATDAQLVGRGAPGADLLPTNGGVAGAAYLFNWWNVRPTDFMDIHLGWVWGRATSDVVDVYRQRSQSRTVGPLGGDSSNRGLGFELDASIMFHTDLKFGFRLQGGVEGGVLFPGNAFDDDSGEGLGALGLVRARLGFLF